MILSNGNAMTPTERLNTIYFAPIRPEEPQNVRYIPRPTDVIIVGPTKCGTTWLQQILHQIRTKGDESFQDIYNVTWRIPHGRMTYEFDVNTDQVATPRIFKTHATYDNIPKTDGLKYIFITRNPYDSYWSYVKFILRYFGADEDLSDEQALDIFHKWVKKGDDYFEIVNSWYAHRADPDVLWLHYEDLKGDLRFCIQKIADFMQITLSKDALSTVYSFCTFEYMSKNAKKFSADVEVQAVVKATRLESWTKFTSLVRKDGGKIGDGVKCMGPRLKKAITERWADMFGKEHGFDSYRALLDETSFLKKHGWRATNQDQEDK